MNLKRFYQKFNFPQVCHCDDGYAGDRCAECADNFFGHPELPRGTCQNCDCSNNWDSEAEGNCDRQTGECLKCLFDTEVRFN